MIADFVLIIITLSISSSFGYCFSHFQNLGPNIRHKASGVSYDPLKLYYKPLQLVVVSPKTSHSFQNSFSPEPFICGPIAFIKFIAVWKAPRLTMIFFSSFCQSHTISFVLEHKVLSNVITVCEKLRIKLYKQIFILVPPLSKQPMRDLLPWWNQVP